MFSSDKSVMLLVDVQGHLSQLMYEKDKLFNSLSLMIKGMQILDVPILWIEQLPLKLGPTADCLAKLINDNQPITKSSFSSCGEPSFMEKFNALGRTDVLLTGIEAHVCVCQTGLGLMEKGSRIQVVTDCVSSRTQANKETGISRLIQAGAQVTSVEMAFFELMGVAKGDKFRQIIKLIR